MKKMIPNGSDIFNDYVRGWNDCVDKYRKEQIPIDFILTLQEKYDSLLEHDLYEDDDIEESRFYWMKTALFELMKEWEKQNESNISDKK